MGVSAVLGQVILAGIDLPKWGLSLSCRIGSSLVHGHGSLRLVLAPKPLPAWSATCCKRRSGQHLRTKLPSLGISLAPSRSAVTIELSRLVLNSGTNLLLVSGTRC